MHVNIGYVEDSNIKVRKTMTKIYNKTGCRLIENTNIVNPSILVTYDDKESGLFECNYVQIPKFNRYYYINNITFEAANTIRLDLKCDVLMSFKSDILESTQFVERNANKYNGMLVDGLIPIQARKNTTLKNYGNSLFTNTEGKASPNDRFFVLQTNGVGGL